MINAAATPEFYNILKNQTNSEFNISIPSNGGFFDVAIIEALPSSIIFPFCCRILITPPQLISPQITADTIVTYGFGEKNTVTVSSVESPVIAIQRKFKNIYGIFVDEQEIKLPNFAHDPETAAALSAFQLAVDIPLNFEYRQIKSG